MLFFPAMRRGSKKEDAMFVGVVITGLAGLVLLICVPFVPYFSELEKACAADESNFDS